MLGNRKVGMVPLKDQMKTTGYEHGANTPIGSYERDKYPIYKREEAERESRKIVRAGKIGRLVGVDPKV